MFINPTVAVEQGWITFPATMSFDAQQKCIQPNAIDFTLDHLNTIVATGPALISETGKRMREVSPLSPTDGFWDLELGLYDFMSDFYVHLPLGVAAVLVPRSTFVRNGFTIISGLWDSGFKGNIGGVLHNKIGLARIEHRVRVGQLIFVKSEAGSIYAGGYNTDPGVHWTSVLSQ